MSHSWDVESYMRMITIPHGPLALAAGLIKNKISVEIIDEVVLTTEVAHQKLKELIVNNEIICVGITTMTGAQIRRGRNFAKVIRDFNSDIPIVWGGAHPSIVPESTIKDEFVDFVVCGDGDETFPLLVNKFKLNEDDMSDVPGLCYIDKKNILNPITKTIPAATIDLNNTPPLPYHLIEMEKYITSVQKKGITRYFEVNSSRGCPFTCAFCYNSKGGSSYIKKDAVSVMEEIALIIKEYNIDGLGFSDENFIMNKQRIIDLANVALEKSINLKIRSGGRVELFDRFDHETLMLLKKAGFYHFGFGVESGSEKTLVKMNKAISLKQIHSTIDKINEYGFMATYNFLAGIPGEDEKEFKKTLELIYYIFKTSKHIIYPISGPAFYTPFPGTINFDEAVLLGHKPPTTFEGWQHIDYVTEDLNWIPKQLRDFIVKSRNIIAEINQKFTGENAVITDADLLPLKELFDDGDGVKKSDVIPTKFAVDEQLKAHQLKSYYGPD